MKKLLPILIFILYLVLFHIPVKPEFIPALLASSDIPDSASARAGEEPILSFRGIDCAGYIDDKGKAIFVRTSEYPVQTAGGYCLVMTAKGKYSLLGMNGESIADFDFQGTADFQEEALFVRSYDFRGLSTYTKGGKMIWSRQFGNPVTTYRAASGITAVGLSDGSMLLLGSDGDIIYQRKFDYAGIPCIYSLAISSNADKIAVIHGNDPQFLHVLHKKDNQDTEYSDFLLQELSSDFRTNVFLFISADENTICYKTTNGLGWYSLKRKRSGEIVTPGNVLSAAISPDSSFVYIITESAGRQQVNYADLETGTLTAGSGVSDYLSLSLSAGRLLVATGNRIVVNGEDGPAERYNRKLYLYDLELR